MFLELLKAGDTIALAASARKVEMNDFLPFKNYLESIGYKVILAQNLNSSDNQFAGTDSERVVALNELIKNPEVKAIIGIRGGYGTVRIVDKIDWKAYIDHPKWICGFSDMTVLLNHVYSETGFPAIHSDMAVHYSSDVYSGNFISLLNLLENGVCELNMPAIQVGESKLPVEGIVVGGNLSVLYSLIGSRSFPSTENKILFLEDLDEYLYHIDRMIVAMKRAGCLRGLKAVVVGGMTEMHDNAVPFGKTAEDILRDIFVDENIPVYFGFPAGHQADNKAFFIGERACLIQENDVLIFRQKYIKS